MPDKDPLQVPESKAVPKKRTRLSLVWIIPIVAAAAGVWIAVTNILNRGPEITIVFSSADGLEPNKTVISFEGLTVGTLTTIRLADDHHHVIATAAMDPKVKDYLVKDLKFWVVRPRISGLNITGLGTLLSGDYIGVQLGQSHESESHFIALESPPLTGDVPGRFFTLKTARLGSLDEGTPIYFRQMQAGQVVSYDLDKDGQSLNVKIFVQEPYDQFVTSDTRFWQASGVDVALDASGLKVQTESVMSILAGGIAFETPATVAPPSPAAEDAQFTLFNDRNEAFRPPPYDPVTYVVVFKQSVRGLSVGAPVELGGIHIGEVTGIQGEFNVATTQISVPVTISLDAERFGVKFYNFPKGEDNSDRHKRVANALVARGLRAELKTGSLLTGALYIAINFYPDQPLASVDWSQNPPQLPTMGGKLEAIEDSVAGLLKNLDKTVSTADTLLGTANQLIDPNSVLITDLNNLLLQCDGAARAVRVLADYLERHPEALIRGKTEEAK